MDEAQSLEALANFLDQLSQKPYDISLHAQHIRLAQSSVALESQAHTAREMLVNFLAAGADVWIPLIEAKENSQDLESVNGVQEMLALYHCAEADYMSIPILQKHISFLVDRYAHFSGLESKPEDLGELFSTEWTRSAIADVVSKGIGHLTQSHLLWDAQRDWELERLETAATKTERQELVDHVEKLHLDRLRQPHSNHEDTSQSYSSFTTNYKPPQEYERLLVVASKLRSHGVKSYTRRESSEAALAESKFSLDAYARYVATERRAKHPDMFIMRTVYERAVAEAAKRLFSGEPGAEEALRSFWVGYCDVLRVNDVGAHTEHETLKRAVRSIPASGELWARYLRYLERVADSVANSDDVGEAIENPADVYAKALSTNLIQTDVEQIVPLVLARAGYEKRRMSIDEPDEDVFATLIEVLERGIQMVRAASPTGDPRLRLEKYLTELYLRLAELPDSAINVWQLAAKHYKTSYLAWTSYTDVLIQHDRYDQARAMFKDLCMKNLDWPEAIWEAWISFEHQYGSVGDVIACLDKVERAQYQVNARRAREAEKASYQAMQMNRGHEAATVPVASVPSEPGEVASAMVVDISQDTGEGGVKRKAEDNPSSDGHKKARIEQKTLPLKRDRENSTVFVADLPNGVTEDDLKALFKDCGKVREVKITELPDAVVATVEFFERENVPGALTKDKKRLREQEVAVHLAWKSTLYVTNFPAEADDSFMRDLFGKFGTIFDIRWPSRKFKNTRRFCYIQYTSPSSADKALELHGQVLEPGQALNVYISNPERKKERTDADANDREIYVAGLSKYTTKSDLENLFKTYGVLKEVRMATEKDGNCKGFAFVEFEQEKDALAALSANNHELKKRRIAVTLADNRARARSRNVVSDTGLSKQAESRSRSVRVHNLPPAIQEGLLQQVLEKYALVKRVEVLAARNEAVVELENVAEAGKLLLRNEPILFDGNPLELTEEGQDGSSRPRLIAPGPATKTGGLFVPRAAVSRPRVGLGRPRKQGIGPNINQGHTTASTVNSQEQGKKGQDDFRKMINGQ